MNKGGREETGISLAKIAKIAKIGRGFSKV
jgi:hypothetical protein